MQVPGALFSVGDAHFAQGDGESCGTAVETRATFVARFDVLKGEATRQRQRDPSYALPGHAHHGAPGVHGAHGVAASKGYYATTGMSLRSDGRAESEDVTLAARNALINMIDTSLTPTASRASRPIAWPASRSICGSARSSTCPT